MPDANPFCFFPLGGAGAQPSKKPGATTFAEMGIATGKVEDKDCVIM
jgi:hypothetical protein